MTDKPSMEIPAAMREMAEQNVTQARNAYAQFLDMARQAQDVVAKSSDVMAESAREIQSRALRYAQENVDQSFNFAADLARARDLKEYMEIQARYAQRQMKTYTDQAQELGRLMSDAAQRIQKR